MGRNICNLQQENKLQLYLTYVGINYYETYSCIQHITGYFLVLIKLFTNDYFKDIFKQNILTKTFSFIFFSFLELAMSEEAGKNCK